MHKRFWLFTWLFLSMVIVDQLVKAWARGAMVQGGSIRGLPWPGIFEVTLTYNTGIAFGKFQGLGKFLAPVAVAIAIGAGYYSWKHEKETVWTHAAMGLLAAGAVGNLYDRVFHERVTDLFYFRLIDFPVFNVADACITVATAMLIITWTIEAAKQKETQKLAGTAETQTPEG